MIYEEKLNKLFTKAAFHTYYDILSLKNAGTKKYEEIVSIRNLVIFIFIEDNPDVCFKAVKKHLPSVKYEYFKYLRRAVHMRMARSDEYIDLYRKIKYK
jgi:hypothetical protein